jgi:signal-transduction protein with cAMP-binding, CBS, and nucleotidyltransferase domain
MTQNPVTVAHDTTLDECAKMMSENHVGALLVKKGGNLVGIVTEQDIVRKAVLANSSPSVTIAETIMERSLIKVSPKEDLKTALKHMGNNNVRHLPVFNKGDFIGLLTTKDILKIQPDLFEILADNIELKEEGRKPINNICEDEGICEHCGNYSIVLSNFEGSMVCDNCRHD